MSSPRTSVELAHVYRGELDRDGIEAWVARLRADMDALPCGENYGPTLVFVDDYPQEYDARERDRVAHQIANHAENAGLPLDVVAFESGCAGVANLLGQQLPHSEWWLTRNGATTRTAVLIKEEAEGLWTCPALSAVWTLARLGVEPYRTKVLDTALRLTDSFEADTVLTVLPTQYIGNEAAVVDMLRQLRKPRIKLGRVQYVFT